MNVNLLDQQSRDMAEGEIDNHIISMATAGFPVTGNHLLWPEGREFPGSYQVWLKIASKDTGHNGWIYVNSEGVVLHRDYPGEPIRFPVDEKEDTR